MMKERVGDEKLIIIGVAVRGINDHIRFYKRLVSRTDRARGVFFTDSNLPTNGTRSSFFFFFFPRRRRDV